MKTFRPFAVVLFAIALALTAAAQESSEVAGLRAKAIRGNGIAQYNLGLAYAQGRGIAADQVEAFVWLSLARENGTRGRDLDNVIGALDRASLDLAQQRLVERRTTLNVRPAATATPRRETPAAENPAPAAVNAPAVPAPAPAGGGDDSAAMRAERDALAARINSLSGDLANLRSDRDRLAKLAADNERATRAGEARIAEVARAGEATKAELARTRQSLTALEQAPKPAADTSALDAKNRELQAALAELESARSFGRQVEETLNKVNDDKARVAAAAATELETARNFGRQVEDTLNKVNDQKAALETQLAQAKADAPRYPDLRNRVTELETQFAALSAEAGRSKQEMATLTKAKEESQAAATQRAQELNRANAKLAGDEAQFAALNRELEAAKASLAQANQALAAKPAAPGYPDLRERVASLESGLTAARNAAPAYPNLSGKVSELETSLAQASSALVAARNAAPAYPDLRGRVTELESQVTAAKAELEGSLARANTALASARDALAAEANRTRQAEAALIRAKAGAPAYPDLRSKVGELETRVAGLISSASDAQRQVASLTAAKDAAEKALAAKPTGPTYPDLRDRVTSLESDLTVARNALSAEAGRLKQAEAALVQAKAEAPAYPNLSGRVTELETSLAQTNTALIAARNAAPAYPNLSGRVTELESTLSSASTESNRLRAQVASLTQTKDAAEKALAARPATPAYPDLSARVRELEASLAAKPAAPTSPDLSGRVAELETALADSSRQLVALQNAKAAPAYPDLSARVTELEAAVATAIQKFGAAEQARADISRQFDDYKGATAAAQRERITLQSNLKMLESDKVALRRQVEAATAESNQLRTQVATLRTQANAVRPAAPSYPDLSGKVAELETALAAARNAAPSYPDLSGRVNELETALTAARNASPAYPNLSGRVRELEASLAAKPTAPGYPDLSGRVSELETALTSARNAAPAYPDLSGRVRELEASLAAKPAAPSYPDLSGRVTELEASLAQAKAATPARPDQSARVAELGNEVTQLRADRERMQKLLADTGRQLAEAQSRPRPVGTVTELSRIRELETQLAGAKTDLSAVASAKAELETQLKAQSSAPTFPDLSGRVRELEGQLIAAEDKLAAAKPAAPAYPDLSGKVAELNGEVTQLRTDRERMQQMLANAGRQLRDTSAEATRVKELETQLAALGAEAARAKQDVAALTLAKEAVQAQAGGITSQRDAALTAQNELRGTIARLEQEKAQLAAAGQPIQAGAPAYPDLSGRVRELEAQVAAASRPAAPTYPDLSGRVTELETQLATARRAAPAYPNLSGRVSELETQLAQARTASRTRAPDYPDLSGRVSELETALAESRSQLAAAQTAASASPAAAEGDSSDLAKRLADTENRLATSLRGYAQLQRERDTLADNAGRSTAAVTAERDALAAQVATLTGQVDQLRTTAQTSEGSTQAELARLGEAVGALQRTQAQASRDLAAARALAQQLQGANSVLAGENYQLKTALSRPTGPGTPTRPTAEPAALPAGRTHVVANGDSLSRIAQRYYGTPSRWQEIYNANAALLGPNGILRVGTELRIP